MVFDSILRRKKPTSAQALSNLISWIKILCSGCFVKGSLLKRQAHSVEGTMLPFRRANRLAKVEGGDDSVGKSRSELFALETPKQEEEEGDMFEGNFYVGSKALTEVELRSPVEESKGLTAIVKASRSCQSIPISTSSSPLLPVTNVFQNESSSPGNACAVPTHPQDMNDQLYKVKARSKPINIASPSPRCNASKSLWMMPSFLPQSEDSPQDARFADTKNQLSGVSMPDRCELTGNLRQHRNDTRMRTRSLTDHDFAELRGCIDLGFVFTQDDIPDLRDTLPALEVCYAITQKQQDPPQTSTPPVSPRADSMSPSPGSSLTSPISSWKIASPGDQPQQVKARLRHWAQAVACSVRQSC